jgi:uncharacterized protein YbjQ (UPF0145 family)
MMFADAEGVISSIPWVFVIVVVGIFLFIKIGLPMIRGSAAGQANNMTFHTTEQLEEEIHNFNYDTAAKSATLTPHEIYLMKQAGYEPVQIVFGNVVYSMGVAGLFRTIVRAFTRGEMYDFTRLNKDARQLARNRLLAEAHELGADHVFGVVFDTKEYADFIEIIATGTACKKVSEGVVNQQIAVGV